MFEPLLQISVEEKHYDFMVDNGATVSLINPVLSNSRLRRYAVQARGVSGTNLEVLRIQTVKFQLFAEQDVMKFTHDFVVCPLQIGVAGIHGMDFFQKVCAQISLPANRFTIDGCSFRLNSRGNETWVSHSDSPLVRLGAWPTTGPMVRTWATK
jgi:hypothetical protein